MKQKIVVKVTMKNGKSRSKALKIAVGLGGVESASLKGDDKSQIEVTGDGVDPVKLICQLRKNVGYAELVSVVGEKEEPKDKPKQLLYCTLPPCQPEYYCAVVPSYVDQPGPCSIL